MKISRMRSLQGTLAGLAAVAFCALPNLAQAQAQPGSKWITVVMPSEPPSLDNCNSTRQIEGRMIRQNLNESLVDRDPDTFALIPRLATSWKRLDANAWEFKLRQGVMFHDGTPFNAAAAKKSILRTVSNTNSGLACNDSSNGFTGIKTTIDTPDDSTLIIRTDVPQPIMPMMIANLGIGGPNTPDDKVTLHPVGTGPFEFDRWTAGQEIAIKRNPKYWGDKAQADGVRFIFRAESSVRAAMVKLGEADIAIPITKQDANEPTLDFSNLNSETFHLRIDAVTPPLNDVRVRKALGYAIDRKSMVGSILPPTVLEATQIVVPAIPGHNHELDKNQRGHDLAMAKKLLAEAKADGVKVDTEITLIGYPAGFPEAPEVMEATRDMLVKAGFNIKYQSVDPGLYYKWNQKPFPDPRPPYVLQSSHDNLKGDPMFSIDKKYGCTGQSSGFCSPDLDKAMADIGSTLEGKARYDAYVKLFDDIYNRYVPDVPMFHMITFTRVSKRLDFVPNVSTNNEIQFQKIKFKS